MDMDDLQDLRDFEKVLPPVTTQTTVPNNLIPRSDGTTLGVIVQKEQDSPVGSGSDVNDSEALKDHVRSVHGFTWVLVVFAITGSTFLYALDNTIVADVGIDVVSTLGQIEKLPWLGTAFTLSSMSTILVWSKVYTLWNAKPLYFFSSVIFEIGSALCGAAPTMNVMIVGRAIAGLGASGIYIGSLTLISVNTSEQERSKYMSYTGLSWGAGFVLGPVIGGAFAESNATWRWAFYINLVLFGVFGPIIVFMVPTWDPKKGEVLPFTARGKQMDWIGSVLEIGACVAGVMAISFGGTIYQWGSGQTIALFVTSAVLFILFALQQTLCFMTRPEERIFPVQFMRNKDMILLWLITAAVAGSVLVPIYYIPIFFQLVHGDGPVDAAVRLLPIVMTYVFMVMMGGFVVSLTGSWWPWFFIGGVLATIGEALLYDDISPASDTSSIYGYSSLIGIGAGAIGQLFYSVAQFKVKPNEIPASIGFICMGQYLGLTVSLCVSGSVFLNVAQKTVAALLPPETPLQIVRAIIQGTDQTLLLAQTIQVQQEILVAVVDAIKNTYIVSLLGAALTVVATLLLKPVGQKFSK
ncbi:MFS general substrate transporter [Glarea lozoyensis ATCC 20868]|uniref:MFS general substrate transporter n=1 Tax=Glarea lozoyensis (strain ATCC 20868 / MF5171) TaxID=1116229 RepID=S3CL10_GLAL2|nr:MFS general substrate transporter [Glarea lozoyensis ATCC 20868]EPE25899.1 MFS general substrate transporter [Glarea lozoyensis ATCC 20868]